MKCAFPNRSRIIFRLLLSLFFLLYFHSVSRCSPLSVGLLLTSFLALSPPTTPHSHSPS